MAGKEIFDDLGLVVRLNQHIQQVAGAAPHAPPPTHAAPRQSSFKVLAALEAVTAADPRQDAQFEHQREGFAASGAAGLPFHLQGDRELNEGSALAQRRALRFSHVLRAKVAFLWDVARGDKQAAAASTASASASPSSPAEIDEADYMALMLLVFKVLRDDFTLELARRQIRCDWAVDSRQGQALAFEQFFSALFELVDVWTCDVEEQTYVRFLELLLRRVTVRVLVFRDGDALKLALSDNFDDAVVVKAIPLRTIPRFASVARVVAPSGLRTVGELAGADPAAVERQRLDYLQRTGVPSDKIGAELLELLAMFRRLASTLEHADDSLRGDDESLGDDDDDDDDDGDDGKLLLLQQRRTSDEGADAGSDLQSTPSRVGRPIRGDVDASAAVEAADGSPRPGGRRRLNSIHDVSVAAPELVTALKTSFLLEKRISLERQTDAAAVREELAKFGVAGARELGEDAARRQYAALYEMLVVRDGDDLQALARAMLQQIRAALAAHGVAVDDDADAEAAYERFYGAVVAATGETMVADAQQWVQHTLASGRVGDFVQRDYHELRPVDEVALLGSQPGDDEFLALVAVDDADGDDSGGGSGSEAAKTSGRRQSASPIRRKPGQCKPSQRADGAKSLKRALPGAAPPVPPTAPATDRRAPRPQRSSGKRSEDRDDEEEEAGEELERRGKEPKGKKPKRGRRKKKRAGGSRSASERSDDELEAGEAATSELDEHRGGPRSETASRGGHPVGGEGSTVGTDDGPSEASGQSTATVDAVLHADDRVSTPSDDQPDAGSHSGDPRRRSSAGETDATAAAVEDEDDELARRRAEVAPRPSRAGPLASGGGLETLAGNHADSDEREREPQGVDFAFAEAAVETIEDEPKPEPARPADLPPKVPEIVVGGVTSGTSAAAAGRYIQLLGLGSVTTAADEASLLALLASDAGRDVDLVCFDVGNELDAARDKLLAIQRLVGRRVGLIGGIHGPDEPPSRLEAVVAECLGAGALFFATLPVNFPLLREQISRFFEASLRAYVLRSRKPAGRAAAALQSASRAIGTAGLFALQDAEPSRKLSTASAAVAHSGKGGLRTLSVAIPGLLPALGLGASARRLSAKAAEEARAPELAPSMPLTPRSLKSHKKSPRLSAALNKLIR